MADRIAEYISRFLLKQKRAGNLYSFLEHFSYDISKTFDDFHGPVLDANKWGVNNGGGAGAASPAVSVGVNNGVVRLTTGTAGDGTADSFLSSGRHFRGDQNAIIQVRLQVSAITGVKIEAGFADALASGAAHVVNVKATPTFVATDGVVWILDTNENGQWDGLGVSNGTAATRMTTYAVGPTAATQETLQIALLDTVAYFSHFDVNGKRDFGPVAMTAAVRSTILLTPWVSIEARNATSKNLDVDYVLAYQARTSTP